MSDNYSDEDRPYTEAQWEALFRKSDLKAAKYEELLETLGDEPDGQLIIAREMGWNRLADELERRACEGDDSWSSTSDEFSEIDLPDIDADEEEDSWLDDEFDEDDDDEIVEPMDREREQLNCIPAYRAAHSLAERVTKALHPLLEQECADEDLSRLLGEAYISAHQAVVKIAGGHGMGYDDEVLCGNIVNNRIALDAVKRSQQAWAELQEQHIVTPEVAEPLIQEMREVEKLIAERIAELRERVWW